MSFQILYHKESVSAWTSDQQPRFILIHKFFQQFLIDGLQTVPSTNVEYGQIHHDFRIISAFITNFFTIFSFITPFLHQFFIHHAVLNQVFIHHDLLITFPYFPIEGVETCQNLNQFSSFTSLDISGIFSSIRLQHFSDVTTLSSIRLVERIKRRNFCTSSST